MRYSEVNFYCTNGESWQQELLIQDLGNLGFDTFEERDFGFSGYLPTERFDADLVDQLLRSLPLPFHVDYEVKEIETQNWNAIWESNFSPIMIDDQCYVRASFHPARRDVPLEIVITPKMSFGTGHHQTTAMMARYILEGKSWEGKSVLDMGCGTGILGILAAKMGASDVLAIDNDEICVENTLENAQLNNVKFLIKSALGSVEKINGLVFDAIFANINRNILLEHMSAYSASMRSGSSLYISGFYRESDLEILKVKAEDHNLAFISSKFDDPWAAAHFEKIH